MQLAIASPAGPLVLTEQAGKIVSLNFADRPAAGKSLASPLLREAAKQLAAYFARRLEDFDLPLAADGTPFQKLVWRRMQKIRYGETMSYGEMAEALSTGPRAIGGACAGNPICILIPCHRVLGAHGALGGYSGAGGLATKRYLLELEGATARARCA